MRIDVTEYEKKYTIELRPVTQLCGQNVAKKTYILESIRRYFSTHKYSEEKNRWRDNVKIDGAIVGRKYFAVLSISEIADVLTLIKCSKQSLMMEYLKQLMQRFDWQLHLRTIDEELEEMFQIFNLELNRLGDIELIYDTADIWDMIQKSKISAMDQMPLDDKENYELLLILINLLEETMRMSPKKIIVIFENVDHLVTREEYKDFVDRIKQIAMQYDIYFILSTSLEKYVKIDTELCPGICVWGEIDFQMPEYERLLQFVKDNYPCNKDISGQQLESILINIIQKIGQHSYISTVEENVICKLINQTLLLKDKWSNSGTLPEIAFLKN